MSIASCPVTGPHGAESGSVFFIVSHQIFTCTDEITPESYPLPQLSRLKNLGSLLMSDPPCPLTTSTTLSWTDSHLSLVPWSPELDPPLQMQAHQGLSSL